MNKEELLKLGKYNFDLELIHQNSLLLILEQVQTNSLVLEFGPANGRLTKYLKEELGCKVYLAELDEQAGREALAYGEDLVVGDIENYEWLTRYRDIRFDYLIFADVLEHLRNPLDVLVQAKLLLKEDGSVLLSVPNFAHNAILINMLNNDFQYRDIGLLDNTHIHMFTKNSLEQTLVQAGLFPVKRMATYGQTEQIEISASVSGVRGIDPEYWKNRPYGEVYQFVYEAKKESLAYEQIQNNLIQTTQGSSLQVFWSTGDHFYEDFSQRIHVAPENETQEFQLMCNTPCCMVRIDPLENCCLVKLISCVSEQEDEITPLILKEHNAKMEIGGLYYFETTDPQWTFYSDTPISCVKLTLSYLCVGHRELLEQIFREESLQLEQYKKELSLVQQENQKLLDESSKREDELRHQLNLQLEQLKNQNRETETQLKETLCEAQEENQKILRQCKELQESLKISEQKLSDLDVLKHTYEKKISEQQLIHQGIKNDRDALEEKNQSLMIQVHELQTQLGQLREQAETHGTSIGMAKGFFRKFLR